MARRRTRRARTWDGCSCGAEVKGAVLWVAGHGEGRGRWRPIARAGGDVRGARAARIPVGSCQGRGAGKACAGARGKCARKSWCWARGELGADGGESTHSVCRARCRALCEALLRANRCYLVGFSCAKLVRAAVKPRRFRKKDSGGAGTHTSVPVRSCTVLYCTRYPVQRHSTVL